MKTLRSKLHARRTKLNEAIEKESMFLEGSQRLANITTDPKSKDKASLEKDFAESKIKTLQAELTKINSSLHAYQAERCVDNSLFYLFISSVFLLRRLLF